MPDCQDCQHDYFCCKLKVKTTFWERLKIYLKGHQDFIEKDPLNRKLIIFTNNLCFFLKNNQCQIYKVRPKPCRDFPFEQTCQECYENIIKIKRKPFDSTFEKQKAL